MTVVYAPQVHRCTFIGAQAGRWWMQRYPELRRYPDGTVRACPDCGRTWVAGSAPGMIPSVWRPEGRLERWLRARRETARGNGPPTA